MKKTLNINGQLIETKRFKTLKAAENFMSKVIGRTIVFFRSSEYYVSI